MNMNFKALAALCALAFAMTGCQDKNASDVSDGTSGSLLNSNVGQLNIAGVSEPDIEFSAPDSTDCAITFSDGNITVSGTGASVKDNVVTISRAGVFELSGSSSDARIVISAGKEDLVTLIMNGVSITSKNGSVIDCEGGKSLALYLADGTENTVADSADYTFPTEDTEPDGAVFSRADTVITGGGSLSVTGNYKDAIKCKDGLSIRSGKLSVTAADDGIVGKDYVRVSGGEITVNAQSDGIKSTNNTDEERGYITISGGVLNIAAERDGIQAEKSIAVEGGSITVFAGGEEANASVTASGDPFDRDRNSSDTDSKKGVKAGTDILISGGEIGITSADDSIHSNSSISIEGGTLDLSSCDDGIHADESLVVADGKITVAKSYEGLEGKNISIGGGEISIRAADDGLNAAGGDNGEFFGFSGSGEDYYISISGGNITVNADGDGLDSNGTIAQSGGNVIIYGPENSANGAIDYERSYTLSGGTLIALGASGMAQAPSTLSQPCLSINSNVSAGSTIEVRSSDDTVLLSAQTPKKCQSLIFSSGSFTVGEEYKIYAGGELISTLTADEGVAGNGANGAGGGHGGFGGGHGGFGGGMGRPGDSFGGSRPDGSGAPSDIPNGNM